MSISSLLPLTLLLAAGVRPGACQQPVYPYDAGNEIKALEIVPPDPPRPDSRTATLLGTVDGGASAFFSYSTSEFPDDAVIAVTAASDTMNVDLYVGITSSMAAYAHLIVLDVSSNGAGWPEVVEVSPRTLPQPDTVVIIQVYGVSAGTSVFSLSLYPRGNPAPDPLPFPSLPPSLPSPSSTPIVTASAVPAYGEVGALALGSTVFHWVADEYWRFYSVLLRPYDGQATFTVYLDAASGDPDLYVSTSYPASGSEVGRAFVSQASWSASRSGSDSLLGISTHANLIYIGVLGFTDASYSLQVVQTSPLGTPTPSPIPLGDPTASSTASLVPGLASPLDTGVQRTAILFVSHDVGYAWRATTTGAVTVECICLACNGLDNFALRVSADADVLLGYVPTSTWLDEASWPVNGTRRVTFPALLDATYFVRVVGVTFASASDLVISTVVTTDASAAATPNPGGEDNAPIGVIVGALVGGVLVLASAMACIVFAANSSNRKHAQAAMRRPQQPASFGTDCAPVVVSMPPHAQLFAARQPPPAATMTVQSYAPTPMLPSYPPPTGTVAWPAADPTVYGAVGIQSAGVKHGDALAAGAQSQHITQPSQTPSFSPISSYPGNFGGFGTAQPTYAPAFPTYSTYGMGGAASLIFPPLPLPPPLPAAGSYTVGGNFATPPEGTTQHHVIRPSEGEPSNPHGAQQPEGGARPVGPPPVSYNAYL